jgi:hypothetical protein
MLRRIIFILSFLIIALSAPVGFMVMGASAQDQPPPEEFIPEGDPTPPPALTVQNPELVVVPSGEAQVYMVPNMSGVYFYDGRWYRHHHGVWFGAAAYNEPWAFVQPPMVPSFVVGVPPDYPFYLPRGYHRIHYGEFHSHWRTWDREKHWHNQPWYKNERRAEVRHARERQAHTRMERDRHQRQERIKHDKVGYKQRLADHSKNNKPAHSDKTGKIDRDKGGKIDKTGHTGKIDKTDRTGKTGKIDKTGSAGSTTKTGGITKTGSTTKTGNITKTGGTGTAGSTGSTTKTGSITKTQGATTKTGGTTKVTNQPKPQVQQRVQPKPQVQQRVQPKPQPKPQNKKPNER